MPSYFSPTFPNLLFSRLLSPFHPPPPTHTHTTTLIRASILSILAIKCVCKNGFQTYAYYPQLLRIIKTARHYTKKKRRRKVSVPLKLTSSRLLMVAKNLPALELQLFTWASHSDHPTATSHIGGTESSLFTVAIPGARISIHQSHKNRCQRMFTLGLSNTVFDGRSVCVCCLPG